MNADLSGRIAEQLCIAEKPTFGPLVNLGAAAVRSTTDVVPVVPVGQPPPTTIAFCACAGYSSSVLAWSRQSGSCRPGIPAQPLLTQFQQPGTAPALPPM